MTDTPNNSLDAVLDSAYDEESTEVENTQEEEAVQTPEKPSEEPQEVETEEDAFTKLDPEKLSPELKGLYKSMQADYTRKRQEDAKQVKELEKRLAQIESSKSETSEGASWQDLPDEELVYRPNMTPEEFDAMNAERARRAVINQQDELFTKQAQRDYPTLDKDGRLDEASPNYDDYLNKFVADALDGALDTYVQENGSKVGFDYRGKAQELIKGFDDYISNKNKAYAAKQSEIAQGNAQKFRKQTPSSSNASTKPSGKMGLNESIESALQS